MKKPLGAQISHMLKDRGVDVIFGIPGVHNQELYRGIEEAGITHVLARHEQGAGFMADGYARASGKFGVAYVITGPGLCNTMTALGQAYSDSVPVLAISSCLDETVSKHGQLHQMLDQEMAADTVCDWSYTARSAQTAYQLVDRAVTEFETSRPRPKHIQVPIKQLESFAEPAPAPNHAPKTRFDVVPDELENIARLLKSAQKPLFVFGGGVRADQSMIVRLLEQSGAASFTTYAGRGVVPSSHPQVFGAWLARATSADVFAQADLVIAVGTELSEVDLWRDTLGHSCPMVRVDIDPEMLADGMRADHRILCDAEQFLTALSKVTQPWHERFEWGTNTIKRAQERWRFETNAERPNIVPVCDALSEVLPADAMVFSDMTQFAYVAKEVMPMEKAHHWHHPYGFGTLGYALPAAIGGAMARRDKPTIAIAGDYGFQYTVQELGAAVELGLSLPIIIWDNGKLKEIEESMQRAQIAPNSVVALNPDFCKLADAYGAHACAPNSLSSMQDAVKNAFKADKPTVIYLTPEIADHA